MPTSVSFQQKVYVNPAIAVPGDFIDTSYMAEAISMSGGGYRAALDMTIGSFAWETATGGGLLVSNVQTAGAATALPVGFMPRQANTGTFESTTQGYGYTMIAGQPIKLYNRGAFYAIGTNTATDKMKVFASVTDGSLNFAAAGATVAGSVETGFTVRTLNGAATATAGTLVSITSHPTV